MSKLPSFLDIPERDRRPMSELESRLFFSLLFVAMQNGERPSAWRSWPEHEADAKIEGVFAQSFTHQVMRKRLEVSAPDVKVSHQVWAFLGVLCDSPGKAVMWAYTLACMWQRKPQLITLAEISENFPMGFPSEDAIHAHWVAQKSPHCPLGNRIDDQATWDAVRVVPAAPQGGVE